MKRIFAVALALALTFALACAAPAASVEEPTAAPAGEPAAPEPTFTPEPTAEPTPEITPEPTPMPDMEISSAGIVDGAMDLAYGMHGEQKKDSWLPTRSLPLTVSYIPEGAETLVLTIIDPDGGDWVHWLACDIAVEGTSCEIPENASLDLAGSFAQGRNDFGTNGYGGPTPPSGVHTYVVTVYALSGALELSEGFRLRDLLGAMEGLALAEAVITGTYAR